MIKAKPRINKALRPEFDYDCECGFFVCSECGYPYYPMELYDDDDSCSECECGTIVEYDLTIRISNK